jgi:glycolate oxidase FAD binding subunit
MVPSSPEEAARLLRTASERGQRVRFSGGRTKLGWGGDAAGPASELSTASLDRLIEHNAGDLTAVLEAGVPLVRAQQAFADAGQMLALDPPDPGGATVGGIVATGDSGPLRSRFGSARDLVVGIRVALPDGSVARAGGKVIKNVAGYDLAKLFTGSFGTLGLIVELSVRLHPRPERTLTAAGGTTDPATLARASLELSHAPLEPLALDWRWGGGDGALLARFGGVTPRPQAEEALRLMRQAGLEGELIDDDEQVWRVQREGQRSPDGASVRVSGTQTALPALLDAVTRLGGRAVGRAGLGLGWVRMEERPAAEVAAAVRDLRAAVAPAPCAVLDRPAGFAEAPWPELDPAVGVLMGRVRERFDPTGICNPGVMAA